MYQYSTCDMQRHVTCISCIVNDEFISEISYGILYILRDKCFLQMFFFNWVERKDRLITNKQEFLTLLHLRSFRQFQNLSEKTWSSAAENLIEFCFVKFLSNKSKKCFILVWIIFPSSKIITISILHCVVWTFWWQTLKSQWTEIDVKLQGIFKRQSSSYWPNVGVGDIEKF